MQHVYTLPLALALGLATASALAAPPAGQLLASQCAQCHGTNGNGPGFDTLAGSSSREISNEMLEMKARSVAEGIMGRQAHGYTDAQIQLIADYLSGTRSGTGNGGSGGGDSSTVKPEDEKKEKPKVKKEDRKSTNTSGSRRD